MGLGLYDSGPRDVDPAEIRKDQVDDVALPGGAERQHLHGTCACRAATAMTLSPTTMVLHRLM
jgi:hypothetical protein